jgi:hypothetical protein
MHADSQRLAAAAVAVMTGDEEEATIGERLQVVVGLQPAAFDDENCALSSAAVVMAAAAAVEDDKAEMRTFPSVATERAD